MRTRSYVPLLLALALVPSSGTLGSVSAQEPSPISVQNLLEQGWEIGGYISAWENRSLILFKHKDHKYLVQCSILIDVLRRPRMVTYCYEIR